MDAAGSLPVADQIAKTCGHARDDPRGALERHFRPMVTQLLVCTLYEHENRRLRLLGEMIDNTQPQFVTADDLTWLKGVHDRERLGGWSVRRFRGSGCRFRERLLLWPAVCA
jgi:hypothetical protein